MPGTKVQSARAPIVVGGVGKYEIVATCVAPGSLPDTGIFLLSIVEPSGPKSDLLVRVISLGDPATYSNNRDTAIAIGDTQWRSAEVRLQFTDLDTANAAQKELSQRVNTLVTNFDTANSEFTVVNELMTYPTGDATAQTGAKNNYIASRTATATATTARDAEAIVCNTTETELTTIQTNLSYANSDYLILSNAQAQLLVLNAQYPTYVTSINTAVVTAAAQVNASGASTPEKTTITSTLSSIQLQLQVMTQSNTSLNSAITGVTNSTGALLGVLQARIASLTADETSKNLELRQCRAALTKAQGALDAAQSTENAALAAVRVLCPDFDPNAV